MSPRADGRMSPIAATLAQLAERWERDAETLAHHGADKEATAARRFAAELRSALSSAADEPLTLQQAAAESGVPAETLRRQIREGKLTNVGRKGAPRLARGSLPMRPRSAAAVNYDPQADALNVVGRILRAGGEL